MLAARTRARRPLVAPRWPPSSVGGRSLSAGPCPPRPARRRAARQSRSRSPAPRRLAGEAVRLPGWPVVIIRRTGVGRCPGAAIKKGPHQIELRYPPHNIISYGQGTSAAYVNWGPDLGQGSLPPPPPPPLPRQKGPHQMELRYHPPPPAPTPSPPEKMRLTARITPKCILPKALMCIY